MKHIQCYGETHMERFISATTPDPDLCLAIDWLKGFKSEISGWEAFVKSSAHHARANVNLMGFNNPGVCVNFLRRYRQKAKEYFCQDLFSELLYIL